MGRNHVRTIAHIETFLRTVKVAGIHEIVDYVNSKLKQGTTVNETVQHLSKKPQFKKVDDTPLKTLWSLAEFYCEYPGCDNMKGRNADRYCSRACMNKDRYRTIKDRDVEIILEVHSGLTCDEVGKQYGLAYNSVVAICHRWIGKVTELRKLPRGELKAKLRGLQQ